MLSPENKKLFIKYILVSLLSYGFVFSGLILFVDVFNINKSIAFIVIYAVNYLFLYIIQLKYLFKTKHRKNKLIRFISSILFFYFLANIFYNIGLKLELNYLLATSITIVILFPFRLVTSKFIVFKD
jgi:putative flippase GtrA